MVVTNTPESHFPGQGSRGSLGECSGDEHRLAGPWNVGLGHEGVALGVRATRSGYHLGSFGCRRSQSLGLGAGAARELLRPLGASRVQPLCCAAPVVQPQPCMLLFREVMSWLWAQILLTPVPPHG